MRRLVFILCAFAYGCDQPVTQEPADMVLTNGNIVTADEALPKAEAIAIKDGLILAVGSQDDIASHIAETTQVIDLEGQLAVPGFIEGHGHFMSLGNAKMILDLTKVENWNEIVTMVGDAAENAEPGSWIRGRGWHQEKWDALPPGAIDGMPDHTGLSEVSPNNPVFLGHASGHAGFANRAALELAGIDRNTPDPPGGTIVKSGDGEPTGALRETAQRLVSNLVQEYLDSRSPEERRADDERRAELASSDLLGKGITSFHDAGANFETIDFYKEMAEAGPFDSRRTMT